MLEAVTRTLFLSLLGALPLGAAAQTPRPPNVVLIMADDLGYRELGCYGQRKIRTPHLDRLAAQGMRFLRGYSGNAVCAPSRCVLMTGKHPGHAWIRNNFEVRPEGQRPIPAAEVTLAEVLRARGYVTGAFGKWGLGPPGSAGDPLRQGFDRFFGYNCQRHAHSYYPSYLWDDDHRIALDNDPPVPGHASLPEGADPADPASYERFRGRDYAPDRIHEEVLAFVRRHRKHPFFLYYASIIPHLALHAPAEDVRRYTELGWEDPPFTRAGGHGYTPCFAPRATYAAMISRLDHYVGRLLELLDELGLAADTIVVFTSDNGTTHLGQEVDYEFFESVGELRGLKGSLYEGGVRVPWIVRWPGRVQPGSTSKRIVGFEDLLPTLAEAAGARAGDLPEGLDGISFLPTLRGEEQPPRPFLYREFPGYGGQQAVWRGRYKAVRRGMARGNRSFELYDLEADPGERQNLAGQAPEILEELRRIAEEQHVASPIFPLPVVDRPAQPKGRGKGRRRGPRK